MIPFGLLSGQWIHADGTTEGFSVLELSPSFFTFRISAYEKAPETSECVWLWFSNQNGARRALQPRIQAVYPVDHQRFWTVYRVEVQDTEYREHVRMLTDDYLEYVTAKLELNEAEVAEQRTGYPQEREAEFSADFDEWKTKAFASKLRVADWKKVAQNVPSIAVSLQTPEQVQRFLTLPKDTFIQDYFRASGLGEHVAAELPVTAIEVGSHWCHFLIPPMDTLLRLLGKARGEKLSLAVVLPPMKPMDLDWYQSFLCALQNVELGDITPELIINDTGTAELAGALLHPVWRIKAGLRFDRYGRDPREEWAGIHGEKTATEDSCYFIELKERFQIEGVAIAGWPNRSVPQGPYTVHIPYAALQCGGNCPLEALNQWKDRGKQGNRQSCPRSCRENEILYPDFLHTVGLYNAVFSVVPELMQSAELLEPLVKKAERLVFDLP